jgi:hypothetical protein
MYSSLPSFVLGFHGCDKSVADRLAAKSIQVAKEAYESFKEVCLASKRPLPKNLDPDDSGDLLLSLSVMT